MHVVMVVTALSSMVPKPSAAHLCDIRSLVRPSGPYHLSFAGPLPACRNNSLTAVQARRHPQRCPSTVHGKYLFGLTENCAHDCIDAFYIIHWPIGPLAHLVLILRGVCMHAMHHAPLHMICK